MRKENIFVVVIIALMVIGCGAPTNPTPLPIQSPTLFAQSTFTSLPTVTKESAIPTSTPESPLKTSGPFFTYLRDVDGVQQIVMMDADGDGRKVIELPKETKDYSPYSEIDMNYVSPDGKWLAFYSGFAGNYWFEKEIGEGPFDLTLNLLDLTTEKRHTIIPILSKEYPNNFTDAAKQLNNPDITAAMLQGAFLHGITQAIAWSPDEQYLAFAGQMDGLSSDLYVYEMETKTIRRLSSGDQELQWINWSPDGKWILHGSTYEAGEGMTFDIYAAAVDGSSVKQFSRTSSYMILWLSSHAYFEHENENVFGDYGLRLVDINTSKITKIWDGSYLSYSVDKSGNFLVLTTLTPDISPYVYETGSSSDFVPGLYLIDLSTLLKTKIEFPSDGIFIDYSAIPFDLGGHIFVLIGEGSNSYFLSKNMELISLELRGAKISISPDSNYWVAVTGKTINVYSADNVLVNSIPLSVSNVNRSDLNWRPDSSGLFLVDDTLIYSVNILNGETRLLENKLINNFGNFGPQYKWIDGQ